MDKKQLVINAYNEVMEGNDASIAEALADKLNLDVYFVFSVIEELHMKNYHLMKEASRPRDIICHYCGNPAVDFGFFDEPVCRNCYGGRK